jgi:hypothetical protein
MRPMSPTQGSGADVIFIQSSTMHGARFTAPQSWPYVVPADLKQLGIDAPWRPDCRRRETGFDAVS